MTPDEYHIIVLQPLLSCDGDFLFAATPDRRKAIKRAIELLEREAERTDPRKRWPLLDHNS